MAERKPGIQPKIRDNRDPNYKKKEIIYNKMRLKDIYIVPIIGLGCYDEIIDNRIFNSVSYRVRTIIVLCIRIVLYKELD